MSDQICSIWCSVSIARTKLWLGSEVYECLRLKLEGSSPWQKKWEVVVFIFVNVPDKLSVCKNSTHQKLFCTGRIVGTILGIVFCSGRWICIVDCILLFRF